MFLTSKWNSIYIIMRYVEWIQLNYSLYSFREAISFQNRYISEKVQTAFDPPPPHFLNVLGLDKP